MVVEAVQLPQQWQPLHPQVSDIFIAMRSASTFTPITAPSGPPPSVMMSSVTSSSITVQWDRVSCIDRNSEITGYTVRYGQTGSTTTVMELVSGTSDRMFTASGLIPRTSYTFEVAAVSSEGTGPFSTGIVMDTSVHNGNYSILYLG